MHSLISSIAISVSLQSDYEIVIALSPNLRHRVDSWEGGFEPIDTMTPLTLSIKLGSRRRIPSGERG